MKTSELSFLSDAEKLTLRAYHQPRKYSIVVSEVVSRLAAAILLSPAAALDLVLHTLLTLPTFVYAIGKSIDQRQTDFTLPWQHLQRARNAVAPLLLGSAVGILHPRAGMAVSEATDKHALIGMLSSNIEPTLETTCSPIHSLSIVENMAKKYRYVELSNGQKKEIFSLEHIQALQSARSLEESLERLQAQEWIHKITNLTRFVMAKIVTGIDQSCLSDLNKQILLRISGLLVPVLTGVDMTIALLAQTFFLVTGLIRFISDRGPIYTEVTTNPWMHVSFLIQIILKSFFNIIGTLVFLVSPRAGFEISIAPAILFFQLQMNIVMFQIKSKIHNSNDLERFVIPVIFGNGECSVLSMPTHSMHKTYLIVEKQGASFNLYWVDRPNISYKKWLNEDDTLEQIRSMLNERFPFMDIAKLRDHPVKSTQPDFSGSANFANIAAHQQNSTNCVVSNMFGMLEALDRIQNNGQEITNLRYQLARQSLMQDYGFYKNDFFPFAPESDGYSLNNIWSVIQKHPSDPI